ncbi:hypothetical protein FPQ18DRAFT_305577 [Pyronema domesticum]|nr:hypothetical protein FPQ18DRAFT_305577 [Pyronema domesticum]
MQWIADAFTFHCFTFRSSKPMWLNTEPSEKMCTRKHPTRDPESRLPIPPTTHQSHQLLSQLGTENTVYRSMKIPAIPSIRPNSHDATIHVPISRLLPDKNVPTYRYSQSNEITSPLQPSSSSALHNISNNGNLNGNEVRTKLRLRTATFRSIMTRFFTSLHFSVNAGRHHFYHYHSRLTSAVFTSAIRFQPPRHQGDCPVMLRPPLETHGESQAKISRCWSLVPRYHHSLVSGLLIDHRALTIWSSSTLVAIFNDMIFLGIVGIISRPLLMPLGKQNYGVSVHMVTGDKLDHMWWHNFCIYDMLFWLGVLGSRDIQSCYT